jgi:hypothetical protein
VLLGVYTVVMVLVLAGTHNDPGARLNDVGTRFMTLVVWGLGVAALLPLWTQQARAFFAAWGKR